VWEAIASAPSSLADDVLRRNIGSSDGPLRATPLPQSVGRLYGVQAQLGAKRPPRMVPGGWKVRAAGVYAQVPDLGPGTYRIVITNASAMSTAYTIRHRRGMG